MADVSYFAPGPSALPSASEARESLKKMVAVIVKTQGYDGIQSSAMAYILNNLESLLISLPTHAHELAIMANRRVPSTRDVYLALQHSGPRLRQAGLEEYLQSATADPPHWSVKASILDERPLWCDPFEGCLPSESEDDSAAEEQPKEKIAMTATRSKTALEPPARKRRRRKFRPEMAEVPLHLPSLPPKHTWLSTPSYPAHSMTMQPPLAFLDLKVSSNRLMESSLRGLIRATDAAVLDSQVQRGAFATDASGQDVEIDPNIFAAFKGSTEERQDMSPQPVAPVPGSINSPAESSEQEANRMRIKKGRTLSLRLRTPSMSQANTSFFPPVDGPAPTSRPTSHRQSMSISGPQSAVVSSFSSHFRHNTFSAGPRSANSSQTPLSWNSAMQAGESPLATPLTAGLSYHYPPTPSQTYANEVLSMDGTKQTTEQDASAPVGLPPIVNYKRTWYKKSNSAHSAAAAQRRIKS